MKSSIPDRENVEFILRLLMPENRAVMRIAIHTGLRIDDILTMRSADLYKDRISIYEKKTGKKRVIRLPRSLKDEVLKRSGHIYAFPHRDDGRRHRCRQTVWKDVKRAAKALRIPDNITPHSARKLYANEMFNACGDLEKVARALNHSSSEVTYIYYLAKNVPTIRKRVKKRAIET